VKTRILFIIPVLLFVLSSCVMTPLDGTQLGEGDDIVTVGTPHIDGGCLFGDGTDTYPMDVVSNTVDTSELGEYRIDYAITIAGVTHTCVRIVKVVDDVPPSASLKPGVDTVIVGGTHTDAGITVSDNHDDNPSVDIRSDVDTSKAGTYEIVYVVTDLSGNRTVVTRTVTVLDPL